MCISYGMNGLMGWWRQDNHPFSKSYHTARPTMSGAADAFVFSGTGGQDDSALGRGILGFVLLFSVCFVGAGRSFGVCC